jgi:Transglycosylase SLT domain
MAGLDNIKKYQAGNSVTSDPETPEAKIPTKAPAGSNILGTISMDSDETRKILDNMQRFIESREGFMPSLARGLSAGVATGYGPEALARFEAQKLAEDKQIMDYRTQMSALNAAGTQAQDFAKMKAANIVANEGVGATSGATRSRGNLLPGVKLVNYAGVDMPVEYAMALNQTEGKDEYKKVWNDKVLPFVQKYAEISSNPALDSTYVNVQIKRPSGKIEATQVPVREYRDNPDSYIISPVQKAIADKVIGAAPSATAAAPSAATPTVTTATTPTTGQPKYLATPAAQIASKIGQTKGDFTDTELDNLRTAESSSDPYALHKTSKAMGAYQFTPETFIDLHKRGIKFDPLDEKQSREVARSELNRLSKELGSKELALSAYGGHEKVDPTPYISKILKPGTAAPTATTATTRSVAPAVVEEIPTFETSSAAQKGATKYSEFSGEQQAKDVAAEYKDFKSKTELQDVADRRSLAERNLQILGKTGNEKIAGQLNDPGFMTGMLVLLRDGVQTPYGNVGMASMDAAMRRMHPNMSPETIKDSIELERNLGESGLIISALMKGQGATSNFERDLYQRVVGSMQDNPELLKKLQVMMMARMDLNEFMRTRHDALLEPGKPFDFGAFKAKDPEVKQAIKDYETKLKAILASDMTKLRTPEQARQIMSEAAQRARSANPEAYDKAVKERRSSLVEKYSTKAE